MPDFIEEFLGETAVIAARLDREAIRRAAATLRAAGCSSSASHAANDFRKLAAFEAYAPTDNVSKLTARANDEGWETVFAVWLEGSRLRREDCLLVFSVGGGDLERNVSPNLVKAVRFAKERSAAIVGVVGRDGGFTAREADVAVVIPPINPDRVTPHTEAMHGVIWHLLASHPDLKSAPAKWESTTR
ncbi:MAG: SIS domain-containing protein [Planctomycetota bacterium]|jgi:D-sedoheptulose 7-phosphate isomerase|nr:SIS domain-containing protein [Planctomycetota bacterium]